MKIEGIPEGWELVRVGRPVINVDWVVNRDGTAVLCELEHFARNWPIVRKIENPKDPNQYRPFANAAEFEPHRDRWWKKTTGDDRTYPPCYYNDSYHGGLHFDRCFVDRTFDDGTPFGIEVAE